MARKKSLLKWPAFRYCSEKYKIKRKFTCFGKYQNISSHVLKISSISLVLRTHENADIFNISDEIYLVFTYKKKKKKKKKKKNGERGGSVVECRTPEREVRGSRPTSAVLCP